MVEKSSVVTRAVGRAGGKVARFSGRAVGGIAKRTGRVARKVSIHIVIHVYTNIMFAGTAVFSFV
jgi:hypothetical protein